MLYNCCVATALGEATKLAQTISNFPQECLLRDRQSAFNSCFDAASLEEAFKFEYNNGLAVIAKESVAGNQIDSSDSDSSDSDSSDN